MTSGFACSMTMTSVLFSVFRRHDLLLGGFQRALVLRFLTHALYRSHDVSLLGKKGVAEVRCPLNIVGQPFDDVREPGHRLNAWVPRLLRGRIGEGLALEPEFFVSHCWS
jgi:hypothetical protein